MVDRVGKVFPQVQVTVISLYSGWMPAFMMGTSCVFDGRIAKTPIRWKVFNATPSGPVFQAPKEGSKIGPHIIPEWC